MIEHMFGTESEAVRAFVRLDASTATVGQVEAGLATVTRMRSWLDAEEAALVARSEILAGKGQGAGGRSTLMGGGRTSSRKAAKKAARSKTIADAPELGDALGKGEISADHIDALTRAAADLPENMRQTLLDDAELADAAKRMSPDPFNTLVKKKARRLLEDEGKSKLERQKTDTGLRMWVRRDGMHIVNTEYDPETGARVFAGIEAEVETMSQRDGVPKNDHSRAHALAALVDRGLGAGPNTTPAEIIVIDVDTLESGLHDQSVSETQSGVELPPETVRRLACDAIIMPTVIRGCDGVVLTAGRDIRTANRAQRRALRAMYPTCGFDNCHIGFQRCQIHHIDAWEQGGPTDLDNLIPLCSKHHHSVHEGGWKIHLEPDRTLAIQQRDGRLYKRIPLPSAALAQHLAEQRKRHKARPSHNRAA